MAEKAATFETVDKNRQKGADLAPISMPRPGPTL